MKRLSIQQVKIGLFLVLAGVAASLVNLSTRASAQQASATAQQQAAPRGQPSAAEKAAVAARKPVRRIHD
jgi:hypothetical protein